MDDGVDLGARPAQGVAGPAAGQGLRNMAERARMLGGDLVVRSEPGRGTEVRLAVPRRQSTGDA